MNSEWADVIQMIVVALAFIFLVGTFRGCYDSNAKMRMECVKAGRAPDECSKLFSN